MKKILIALDYHPSAELIAQKGYEIARAFNASVAIVHVITDAAWYAQDYSPIMGFQGNYTNVTNELVDGIKSEAEKYLSATVAHLGDNNITTKVLDGDTSDAVLQFSREWEADLIVLGSHSHHGLEKIFGTDNALSILKGSMVPVLAIPTSKS